MIAQKLLSANSYGHLTDDFKDICLSHPNYPSLYAITDSLNALAIENFAVKIPKEHFLELPDTFLAIFNDELVLVIKAADGVKVEKEGKTGQKIPVSQFIAGWDGTVIAVEPNEHLTQNLKAKTDDYLQYFVPVVCLVLLSFFIRSYTFYSSFLLATTLLGLFLSILVVREKFGLQNTLVAKLCGGSSDVSCNSVIKSDSAKISKWVDFSDLPVVFFGSSFMSILLFPDSSSALVGGLSVLSVPIIGFSIWLQKFQLKNWCPLCLLISFLLLLQGVAFYFWNLTSFRLLEVTYFGFFFSVLVLGSLWVYGKALFEDKKKMEQEVNSLRQFKRNYKIFDFLTNDLVAKEELERLEGIRFGHEFADADLTLILSPSCVHCHNAFKDGLNLIKKFPGKFSLRLLFNVNPENDKNPYKIVVQNLLSIHYNHPDKIEEAIADWHIKRMELKPWLEKWNDERFDMKVNQQLQLQYEWCLANDFNYTPVKIINGKQFPNEYEISELKFFLKNIEEENAISQEQLLQT